MEKKYLCFDIGGLSLKWSIYNDNLIEFATGNTKYNLPKTEEVFLLIKSQYEILSTDFKIDGICISSSGIINNKDKCGYFLKPETGMEKYSLNNFMNWCDIPWWIENDANCALLAEINYGNALGYKNIVLFTIGTALGGAIALNGQIYLGSHFLANEIGCGILNNNHDDYKNISQKIGMNGFVNEYNNITKSSYEGEEIINKAIEGDEVALDLINQRIDNLAMVILNSSWTLDPEIVLIGGGISKNKWYMNKLIDKFHKLSNKMNLPVLVKIEACKFNNDAGKIGALFLKNH